MKRNFLTVYVLVIPTCPWEREALRNDCMNSCPTQDEMCVSPQLRVTEDKRGRGHEAWDRQYRIYCVLETETISFRAGRFLSVKGLADLGQRGSSNPHLKNSQACWGMFGISVLGRWRQAGPGGSLAIQASMLCKFQVSETPCLKTAKEVGPKCPRLTSDLYLYSNSCTHGTHW